MPPDQTFRQSTTVAYYDQLAADYDRQRFGNSYGAYVDAQERGILRSWLVPDEHGQILDLACGTGRLLDMATYGLDASPAMVRIARRKHPHKPVYCGPAAELARLGIRFDAIFCLHLFMHLPHTEIQTLFQACRDALRPRGQFIFDLPSALRRRLTGFRREGWHAGTAFAQREVVSLIACGWRCQASRGILFFPIHRVPRPLRPMLRRWDDLIGTTPLQQLSSYRLFCLKKSS